VDFLVVGRVSKAGLAEVEAQTRVLTCFSRAILRLDTGRLSLRHTRLIVGRLAGFIKCISHGRSKQLLAIDPSWRGRFDAERCACGRMCDLDGRRMQT